ncbi:hypothetical protein AVEN_167449-1 [Araneus ventricosus]|uniref:Uncharacterized protein n=1 Tax=Araneus ventricosus TaxID=182803 RepID=A0A4Y2EPY9_ARAVE|nr:hypothetical protein AVEN_167449-1 [Araneus ventricosus]
MVSSSCMTIPIMLAKLKNCFKSSSGKSGATPHPAQIWHPIWVQNTYLGQGSLQNSDVKTAAENWLNGQRRDFYQAGLVKLFLCSENAYIGFGDYV